MGCLAGSARPLEDRLESAAIELSFLKPEEFEDQRGRELFEQVRAATTAAEPAGEEGRIRASVHRMSDRQAEDVAELILELDAVYRPL